MRMSLYLVSFEISLDIQMNYFCEHILIINDYRPVSIKVSTSSYINIVRNFEIVNKIIKKNLHNHIFMS